VGSREDQALKAICTLRVIRSAFLSFHGWLLFLWVSTNIFFFFALPCTECLLSEQLCIKLFIYYGMSSLWFILS
jgi:hypothetical protein